MERHPPRFTCIALSLHVALPVSAVELTEEQDRRDSRDVSFNGDVTWLISDDTSLRVDAFALTTKRKEHQDTRVYEGDGSVGGLDMDNPELEFQDEIGRAHV